MKKEEEDTKLRNDKLYTWRAMRLMGVYNFPMFLKASGSLPNVTGDILTSYRQSKKRRLDFDEPLIKDDEKTPSQSSFDKALPRSGTKVLFNNPIDDTSNNNSNIASTSSSSSLTSSSSSSLSASNQSSSISNTNINKIQKTPGRRTSTTPTRIVKVTFPNKSPNNGGEGPSKKQKLSSSPPLSSTSPSLPSSTTANSSASMSTTSS